MKDIDFVGVTGLIGGFVLFAGLILGLKNETAPFWGAIITGGILVIGYILNKVIEVNRKQ